MKILFRLIFVSLLVPSIVYGQMSFTEVSDSVGLPNDLMSCVSMVDNDLYCDTNDSFSLNFDGVDDYVFVEDTSIVTGSNELSVMLWYYHRATPDEAFSVLISGGGDFNLAITNQDRVYADIHAGVTGVDLFSNQVLSVSEWYHIALVYDGANLKILINNEEDGSVPAEGEIGSNQNTRLLFGCYDDLGSKILFLDGKLDEISIWDKALDLSEMQMYLESPIPNGTSGLMGYWGMNEGSGGIIYDGSGNGYHGDLYGPIWSSGIPLFPFVSVSDVLGDQGGSLQVSWTSFDADAIGLPDSVVTYGAQRLENEFWTTLTTISATQADNYLVTIPTTDIFTIGQPEPFSLYRIVANSSDLSTTYYSRVVNAYSIDNIAPPKPDGWIFEDSSNRYIICNDPNIPDMSEICLYRGLSADFFPEEPLQCGDSFFFTDTIFSVSYYRIQFMDIHGNLSEFSDVMGSGSTTGVDGSLPLAFAMEQNFPNPFNPVTTIQFSLPESFSVRLNIYDVSGKLVRNLISGQVMDAGHQERVWNGKDDHGQSVSAGVYFYKLNAGSFTETRRMALVK